MRFIAGATLVAVVVFGSGIAVGRSIGKRSVKPVSTFEEGRLQGMRDCIKLLGDLGMEGETVHMGLPIGSGRWMNMKYEVIHSGLTPEQSSNIWFAYQFLKTNSTSITISNASEKTVTVTFPKPYEAKEAKP